MTTMIDQARALADAGEFASARATYQKLLEAEARNPDLLEEVGFFEVQAGQFPQAISLMKLALELRPNDPTSHLNLAETYRLSGASENAAEHYRKVIEANPNDPDAYFGLANVDIVAKRWESARTHLERSLELNPNDLEAMLLHASIVCTLESWVKAEKYYLKILALAPNVHEVHLELARFYFEANRISQAIDHYYKAEGLSPLSTDDLLGLCRALVVEGRAQEAMPIVHRMMLGSNLSTAAFTSRGQVLSTLGMFKEAERDLRAALSRDPKFSVPYEQLGTIHRLSDRDIERLEDLAAAQDISDDNRTGYNFALFNGYKDRKEHARAFEALKTASDLHLANHPVDKNEIVDATSRVIDVFTDAFFAERGTFGHKKPGAIFIVGMPRSGTTLTERVVGAHPDVIARGERHGVVNIVDELENYPEATNGFSRDAAAASGKRLLQEMMSTATTERFATDKLPGNFRYLGLISLVLPNAKIIWCKRNPPDNCLSCYEQHFTSGWDFTYSLEALGVAYRQHERLMNHWMQVCPIPIHTVEYEKLVSEPEGTARSMLDYLGLEWDPICLNPEQLDSNIATASIWQARQPINTGSVEKWRKYEKQLQPLIKALEEN